MNRKEPAVIEYLAFISVKYSVYLAELYQALVVARATGRSVCEELLLEYRGTVKNKAIFLITKDSKVVTQFKVEESFLSRKEICFENWLNTDKVRNQIRRRQNLATHESTLIQDLHHGMRKVNLEAEVISTQKPQLIRTQYGSSFLLTNTLISDATGKVKLCLWGTQSKPAIIGDIIQIKNASVRTFKGEKQVNLGRTGTVNIIQHKDKEQKIIIEKQTARKPNLRTPFSTAR